MPLPSTRLIPARWSEHHQPAAESTMTARCDITRPSTGRGTLNPATGTVTNPSTAIAADVPCRVQAAASTDRSTQTGEQEVTFRKYMVAITADLDVLVDDVVTVTESIDPHLVGRALRVLDVLYGSEVWQRTLTCVDTLN